MKANKNLILIKLEINITFLIVSIFSILKVLYKDNVPITYILFGVSFILLLSIIITAYFHNPKKKIEIEVGENFLNLEKLLFVLSNIIFIILLFLLILLISPYFVFYDKKIDFIQNDIFKILIFTIISFLVSSAIINLILDSILINKILKLK